MARANVDLSIDTMEELPLREVRRRADVTRHYQATEIVPNIKAPLHNLLRKQPAVLGSVQVICGLLSVGIGILFMVSQNIGYSLFSLFRVSQMTGTLFIIAGLISNMLFKYSELLLICLMVNCGCLLVAVIAASMIIIDLTAWNPDDEYLKMEVLGLCILGLESCLSVILCVWFVKEKQKFTP